MVYERGLRKLVVLFLGVCLGILLGYVASKSLFSAIFLVVVVGSGIFLLRYLDILFVLLLFTLPLSLEIHAVPISLIFAFYFVSGIAYVELKANQEELAKRLENPVNIFFLMSFFIIMLSVFQSRFIPDNAYVIGHSLYNYPWVKSVTRIAILGICVGVMYSVLLLYSRNQKSSMVQLISGLKKYIYFVVFYSVASVLFYGVYIVFGTNITFLGNEMVVDIINETPRLSSVEQEPLFFGFYLLTVFPVLCSLWASKTNFPLSRRALSIFMFIIFGALLLTQSRSAILGVLFSILVLGLLKADQFMRYWQELLRAGILKRITFIAMTLLVCFFFVFAISEEIKSKGQAVKETVKEVVLAPILGAFDSSSGKFWSTKTRMIAYEYAVSFFKEHPFLGIGYENYNFHTGQRFYWGLYDFNMNWPEPNNYPLKIIAEVGLIGFVSIFFLVFVFFHYLWISREKAKSKITKALIEGYMATFAGIFFFMLFSSVITRVYLWVTLGFCFAVARSVYTNEEIEYENCN